MGTHVALHPGCEGFVLYALLLETKIIGRQRRVGWIIEVVGNAMHLVDRQRARAVLVMNPFLLHLAPEFLDAQCVDEDLDAGLVEVVAAAVAVVYAQDRLAVGEQVLPGYERTDFLANDRRAA